MEEGEAGPAEATGTERLLRNRRPARRLHAGVYVTTAFLLISGIAVLGEGRPALEGILGGHVAAAHWHRWIGFGLIGAALLVAVVRPGASGRFVSDSVRFAQGDLRWFASYPRFLLRPGRHRPAPHGGHFDPGQRLLNCVIVLSFLLLSVSGLIMSFPQFVVPDAFAWSLRIHRVATWALAAAVTGHVVVASGILPGYRGVWRAMHADGLVPAPLAQVLWPRWAERQETVNTAVKRNGER
jgi:cytochrome b subunit of formate dehydrogenase